MLQKDQTLGKNYRIISRLGTGGMGMVFRATDLNLGREVAIKTMHAETSADEGIVQRFLNEGRILAMVRHPAVIEVYAAGVDDLTGIAFLVMEFVEGQTLEDYRSEFSKDLQRLLPYMIELCEGIHACHQKGVIHRDLKPANVLLNKAGQIKIIDFGIAKTSQKMTRTGVALGTPHYMSPEQCIGKGEITGSSDIYALGVMLWEFLLGKLPFEAEKDASDPGLAVALQHLNQDPPWKELEASKSAAPFLPLLRGMLSKKPEKRPTIPEIVEALKQELNRLRPKTSPATDGTRIGEIYQVLAEIGAGGMGKVYKALDTTLNRTVAIKVMNEETTRIPGVVERFLQEGQLLATVGHPNVLNIFASGTDKATQRPFLVMEFIDGVLLSELKPALRKDTARLAPLMVQLLEGLQACHLKGIIHRDLKPSNVMVTREGLLKIFDFGIAKAHAHLTRTGTTVGTPAYMSPEQCTGKKEITIKSDVYSIGVIFWEFIFGEPPFKADTNSNPDLSIALQHIQATLPMTALPEGHLFLGFLPMVKRMLDKDPAGRPEIEEILTALETFIEQQVPAASTESVSRRRRMSARQSSVKTLFETSQFDARQTNWMLWITALGLAGLSLAAILYLTIGGEIQSEWWNNPPPPPLAPTASEPVATSTPVPPVPGPASAEVAVVPASPTVSAPPPLIASTDLVTAAATPAVTTPEPLVPTPASPPEPVPSASVDLAASTREAAALTASLTGWLAVCTGAESPTEALAGLTRLDELGAGSQAAALRLDLAGKYVGAADLALKTDRAKALDGYRFASMIASGLPGLEAKLAMAEQLLEAERTVKQQQDAALALLQNLDIRISALVPPDDLSEVVADLDRLATEFNWKDDAANRKKALVETYGRAAERVRPKDPAKALAILDQCMKLNPGDPAIEKARKEIAAAIAAKKQTAEGPRQEAQRLATEILKKDTPRFKEVLAKLSEAGEGALAEQLRKDAVAGLQEKALAAGSAGEFVSLQNRALGLFPADDPERGNLEAEFRSRRAARQAALLSTWQGTIEKHNPDPAPKSLAAKLKTLQAEEGKEFYALVSPLVRARYLGAARQAEAGQPEKALGLLKGLRSLPGLADDAEAEALVRTLGDRVQPVKPAPPPDSTTKPPPPEPSVPDEPVGELKLSVDEIKTQLENLTAPENVVMSIDSVVQMVKTLEKKKARSEASLYRDRAVGALLNIAEEDSAHSWENALRTYQMAQRLSPKHPKVLAGIDMASQQLGRTGTPPAEPAPGPDTEATPAPPSPKPEGEKPPPVVVTPAPPPKEGKPKPTDKAGMIGALEGMVEPEAVAAHVSDIVEMTRKLEKMGAGAKAKELRQKAVRALIDIAEEDGSNSAFESARNTYNQALQIIPQHPDVLAGLEVIKGR